MKFLAALQPFLWATVAQYIEYGWVMADFGRVDYRINLPCTITCLLIMAAACVKETK